MWELLVYRVGGKHYYVVLLSPNSDFQTREQVFIFTEGTEEEIFSVSAEFDTPFIDLLRTMISEADRRGIKDIKCTEDLLSRSGRIRPLDEHSPSQN